MYVHLLITIGLSSIEIGKNNGPVIFAEGNLHIEIFLCKYVIKI